MDSSVVAAVSGLIGLLLGLSGLLVLRGTSRRRAVAMEIDEPGLPDGAADVLAVIGQAYVVVDGVDGVVRASPAAYAFGLVRGYSVAQPELLRMIRTVRASGVTEEHRLELGRAPDHFGVTVLDMRVAILGDEYVLLLADDQTEIVRAQSVRSDFVANVSHELKTPVGAIRLLSEAIDDAADDPEAIRHFTKSLHKESGRLTALVQDIMELSRLQGTDVVAAGLPVELDRVINEAVDRNRLTAESRDISIVVGRKVDAQVFGDADLLITALRNLIDNAIRYSPAGTRVGVGVRERDGMVQVSVTDQGPGISEDEQGRIFERFYRIDAARSRQTGGTGLGLSIVKHVMQQHGGEVSVWSREGQGSTFTMAIPVMEDMGAGDASRGEDGAVLAQPGPRPSGAARPDPEHPEHDVGASAADDSTETESVPVKAPETNGEQR
ncbi:two-component sensor histidine kinase [Kocuria coralli]|uniref:Sensor-like histidine kinase SenX3 n=1 Tax=Kocuria coralli TaxID=1461025 RepID=A0A5J5KUS6_9MICC|nr:ATP-binding protein [Kocuria coralli]KAA9393467.1 two-component sensor histidine kinase [Kocuria coralli]